MERNFLENESMCANRKRKKIALALAIFYFSICAFLYFMVKDSIDLNNSNDKMLAVLFFAFAGIMLFFILMLLFLSIKPAKDGKNLILPLGENDKRTVAEIINREIAEGKLLLEKSVEVKGRGAYYDRIVMLSSYFLHIESIGKIQAIPRDKIYWVCAQVGRKGGPFYVRLLLFTESKLIEIDGNDIEYTKNLAKELYQYIPNVFDEYGKEFGEFEFPYYMQQLYEKNRGKFFDLYETEKSKKNF